MAEFTTAVKYKMAITLVPFNNSELAKISWKQELGNSFLGIKICNQT